MLGYRLGDADFTDGDAETLHQRDGIVVGTVGGSESRHSDTDDALAVHAQFIECFHANQQSQRRVESSADANHHGLGMGMYDALRQTHHLDIEDLLAGSLHVGSSWDERMRIHLSLQYKITDILGRMCIYHGDTKLLIEHGIFDISLGIHVGRIGATLRTELLHIYLSHNHLIL